MSSANLAFIRNVVPIAAVAQELGLERVGKMYRCFRPDAHQHGDRTPSMGKARNNRLKCFVCDAKPLSNLDLVMGLLNVSLADAVDWITRRFPGIPSTHKGKHVEHPSRWGERSRIGASASSLEYVIRSGAWAAFSQAERSLLPVLDVFAEPSSRAVTISYAGMMRYSGIASRTTISTVLRTFQKLHLIQIKKGNDEGLRACGAYILTFDDPAFLEYAFRLQSQNREAIAVERTLRAKARDERRRKLASRFITGKNLSTPTVPVRKITVQSECTVNLGNAAETAVRA